MPSYWICVSTSLFLPIWYSSLVLKAEFLIFSFLISVFEMLLQVIKYSLFRRLFHLEHCFTYYSVTACGILKSDPLLSSYSSKEVMEQIRYKHSKNALGRKIWNRCYYSSILKVNRHFPLENCYCYTSNYICQIKYYFVIEYKVRACCKNSWVVLKYIKQKAEVGSKSPPSKPSRYKSW